jgi:hypothetical protein
MFRAAEDSSVAPKCGSRGQARVDGPAGSGASTAVGGRHPATRSQPAHVPAHAGTGAGILAAARSPSAPPRPVRPSIPAVATTSTVHVTVTGPPTSTAAPPSSATAPAAPSGAAATRFARVNASSDAIVRRVRTPANGLRRSLPRAPRTATHNSATAASRSAQPRTRRGAADTRPRLFHLRIPAVLRGGADLRGTRREAQVGQPRCRPAGCGATLATWPASSFFGSRVGRDRGCSDLMFGSDWTAQPDRQGRTTSPERLPARRPLLPSWHEGSVVLRPHPSLPR